MKQVPIRLGPLALLLAVISICLTMLAILTFTTARADLRLAEKSAETVRVRYALEAQGQAFLRQLSEQESAAGEWETDADGVCWTSFEQDGSVLRIGWLPEGEDGYTVVSWRQEKEWEQDTGLGNLWPGF